VVPRACVHITYSSGTNVLEILSNACTGMQQICRQGFRCAEGAAGLICTKRRTTSLFQGVADIQSLIGVSTGKPYRPHMPHLAEAKCFRLLQPAGRRADSTGTVAAGTLSGCLHSCPLHCRLGIAGCVLVTLQHPATCAG
jgi:hypothetical protein